MKTLFWFRRDRRLQDNEALIAAATGTEVHPVFVLPGDLSALTALRQASLVESLRSLSSSIPGGLTLLSGEVPDAITAYVNRYGIERVVATRAFDAEGMREQADVAESLYNINVPLQLIGSYYAIEPGTIRKDDGNPLKVYTPFFRRWDQVASANPLTLDVASVNWVSSEGIELPSYPETPFQVRAGEAYALSTLERFVKRALENYHEGRDRTDLSGTSHLSHALAHGEIHPRTILAALGSDKGSEVFRKEIAWREFYADVLFHNPHTLTDYFDEKYAAMEYDDPAKETAKLQAWKDGKTGFPIVDAAMRQLVQTGWMHNRARMIVASFLVKDLHFEWQIGAEFFEMHLTDFDPASNAHGWQWTAGCGTDASPYFRVFNPVLQGMKFDPQGDYVRRYIPELRHIDGPAVHEPWKLVDGHAAGYPSPIVDHAAEREEALRRLKALKG